MSEAEKQLAIVLQALVKSELNYICPRCYQLFSDIIACYRHCREAGEGDRADDIHKGLGLITKKDFPEFLRCYRVAIGFSIAECDLPLGGGPGRRSYDKCFAVEFVLEKCLPSRDTMDAMWLAVIKI
ncbi:unnamed protein product [Penicillium olsonii]|nr:unnamed protein product [Penicillium olsonii]